MDLKLIEDLLALQQHGSMVRAAQARHITHPAFGRRIRSLQAWAGFALLEEGRTPLRLTPAAQALLAEATPLLAGLARVRHQWQGAGSQASGKQQVLRVASGRTLAHTVVADWLARLSAAPRGPLSGPLWGHRIDLQTAAMAQVAQRLQRGDVDLVICYAHPVLTSGLLTMPTTVHRMASDRLVPVARCDASGRCKHSLGQAPWLAYASGLALGQLLSAHLATQPPLPPPLVVCDSPDALLELVAKGLGVAWLPATLAAGHIKRGLIKPLGGKGDAVHFDVQLVRPRARQSALVEAVWAASTA